jgi:GAF domain-containing protein
VHGADRDVALAAHDEAARMTADLRALADEQTALRQVAELVAAGASESAVFDAVAEQACRLLGGHFTALLRYESDGPLILAMHGAAAVEHFMHVGMRIAAEGDGLVQRVQHSAQAARVDSYGGVPGWNAGIARDLGMTSGVGAPIITEGRVWGAITVLGSGPPLPENAEVRLGMFAKLVAVAIANAQAQTNATALADEQAALRRVAELVARGVTPRAVFAAVATEASRLLGGEAMTLARFESEYGLVVEAACRGPAGVGTRITFEAETLPDWVRRGDRVVRVDDYTRERDAQLAAQFGLAAAVAAPISVQGEVWGMLTATSDALPLPHGTEHRLQQFAKLVAAALANSQARADLQALADEQTALRRIAELSAQEAPADAVLQAVAVQASRLAGVEFGMVLRFVAGDGSSEIVALDGAPANFELGMRASGDGDGSVHRIWRTGRAARVNGLDAMSGQWPQMASRYGFSTSAGVPILLQEGALWGALVVAGRKPMPPAIESHLADFAALASTAISAAQTRAQLRVLADEQAALRRVAELVAREAPPDEVLEAVAVQASQLAGVDFTTLLRFEPDGSTEIVALDGAPGDIKVGMRAPGRGDGAVQRVWRTHRAARIDNLANMSGQWPQVAHGFGFSASAAVPILLERRLWGALVVVARNEPLPAAIENHLTNFAELASTAISAAQARSELRVLAEEQTALRRVAELVARGAALEDVFAAVANEASMLLGAIATALLRYDPGEVAVVVAACNSPAPVGLVIPSASDTPIGNVLRTGRAVRVDSFAGTPQCDLARQLGVEAGVAVPIAVEGRIWGALTASTPGPSVPIATDDRLAQFAELAAAAIANAENKAKLTVSRARVVATADETRRRLQRDLHDGAQQRLVHTLLALGIAKEAAADGRPAAELIDEAIHHAERANSELRNLVRGILPASLTRGGLRAAVESLVSDIPLPIDVHVTAPRLPLEIETTAYFIVAEALTNVVKHAHATRASVEIRTESPGMSIQVRDDGFGGADPAHGTGLTGLLDRVEASDGTLTITSPPTIGTTLHVTLPLGDLDTDHHTPGHTIPD